MQHKCSVIPGGLKMYCRPDKVRQLKKLGHETENVFSSEHTL